MRYGRNMDKRASFNFPLFSTAVEHLGGRAATARQLGVTQVALTHIFMGRNRLSKDMAVRLERLTQRRFLAADLLGLTTRGDHVPS